MRNLECLRLYLAGHVGAPNVNDVGAALSAMKPGPHQVLACIFLARTIPQRLG
jgi:hypothetical protein